MANSTIEIIMTKPKPSKRVTFSLGSNEASKKGGKDTLPRSEDAPSERKSFVKKSCLKKETKKRATKDARKQSEDVVNNQDFESDSMADDVDILDTKRMKVALFDEDEDESASDMADLQEPSSDDSDGLSDDELIEGSENNEKKLFHRLIELIPRI